MPAPDHRPVLWAAPFIPDDLPSASPLWAVERRPWAAALPRRYLDQLSRPGDIVLDPFASQPPVIHLAGASRRRVVVSSAIPASLLAVMSSASPPGAQATDAAFTRIADAPRRGQTLADHLRSLYNTLCPNCAGIAAAEAFVWDREQGEPQLKHYTCPHCQESGLAAVDLEDISRLGSLEVRGAAYWGLLSRLVAPGDSLTPKARSLIDLYVPRTLLAINELITAADQRVRDPVERQAARAMILHVLQATSTLHEADQTGKRSRLAGVLEPPRRFVEHNAWSAFAHAHKTLRERAPHPVIWANDLTALRTPSGEGRVAASSLSVPELVERLAPESVSLILSEPPPFDPSAYLLGFLWTGWLFGREAASHSKSALSIERWSWDWYARAMTTALGGLRSLIRPDGSMVLAFRDSSPRRALALMAAAARAGWRLSAQATQSPLLTADETTWRLSFTPDLPSRRTDARDWADQVQQQLQEAALELTALRAEPAPWPLIVTAAAARWAASDLLAVSGAPQDAARRPATTILEHVSADAPPVGLRLASPAGRAAAQWEPDEPPRQPPLADRVEQFIAAQLAAGSAADGAVRAAVFDAFPGWETPDAQLIDACLTSYAIHSDDLWRLREEDQPARRGHDLSEMLLRLHHLGHALGFQVWIAPASRLNALGLTPFTSDDEDYASQWAPASVVWRDGDVPHFAFAVTTQADLHTWLARQSEPLESVPRTVVLPGGRAELLDFKLRRCPSWRQQLAWSGWEFVKFRHMRLLAAMPDLTLASFRARVGLDPVVTLPGQQLALFEDDESAVAA